MTPSVPLIPRKVLFGNPDKAAARISPDGTKISYLAPVDGVLNVWVGPLSDPDSAKPVTKDTVRGIRMYSCPPRCSPIRHEAPSLWTT